MLHIFPINQKTDSFNQILWDLDWSQCFATRVGLSRPPWNVVGYEWPLSAGKQADWLTERWHLSGITYEANKQV